MSFYHDTPQEKEIDSSRSREQRIIKRLLHMRTDVLMIANVYNSVLPIFKNFVLIFEQKDPLMHRLLQELETVYKSFLTCFLKHEYINNCKTLLSVDPSSLGNSLDKVFVGDGCDAILRSLKSDQRKSFKQKILSAFRETGKYLKEKLPLDNKNLKNLALIDPKMCGSSNAASALNGLFDSIPIKITSSTPKDDFTMAVSALQTDVKFRASIQSKEEDISAWWVAVISNEKYSVISPVIKACLSIFTGPRVEGSFSVMNNIINPYANKMLTKNYEAICSF